MSTDITGMIFPYNTLIEIIEIYNIYISKTYDMDHISIIVDQYTLCPYGTFKNDDKKDFVLNHFAHICKIQSIFDTKGVCIRL